LNYCDDIVLVKGNHDLVLSSIVKKRNIKVVDIYKTNGILMIHGHKIQNLEKDVKTIIIGHEHPAISLKEHNRTETYKCFLKGKYEGRDLLVLPSFNFLHPGSNILKEKTLSPYLEQGIKKFEVYIVENNKVYDFGKVKDL
jgi:putative SbcD/Mre11-related phosphoesterase